ncbi:DUF7507 domain-containing protein [Lysinibacter cavernae]|uniref:Putative repeat protein (TIGR01451 family) n=1 Tax=Lysinibacter cavernae TaxID=1640652 RepID=A0A7X5TTV5_9MICO|nr:SdrD B-like domain-containing protein [Lysinibacter cavernae]NIH53693.1 putative repeat protein (TIGR01451 family) [Lysinibacter cavernae]
MVQETLRPPRRFNPLRGLSVAIIAALAMGASVGTASVAQAANGVDITLSVLADGSPAWDDLDTDANGQTNGIVRTNDTVSYNWGIRTGNQPVNNVQFEQRLPAGMTWDSGMANADCAITEAGAMLTCVLDLGADASSSYTVIANVSNTAPRGTVLTTSLTTTLEDSTVETTPTVSTTVVAQPRVDLMIPAVAGIGASTSPEGVDGYVYAIYTGVVSNNTNKAKGNEPIESDFSFQQYADEISSNARLWSWGSSACGVNGQGQQTNGLPYGRTGITGAATALNSATNSGTWTCSQAAPGDPITVSVTGADTSVTSQPQKTIGGSDISSERGYIAAGYVAVWLPLSDLQPTGEKIIKMRIGGFDPNSISGQSNYGVNFEQGSEPGFVPCSNTPAGAYATVGNDNCYTVRLTARAGQSDIGFVRNPTLDTTSANMVNAQAKYQSGEGVVGTDETFYLRSGLGNTGAAPLTNGQLCLRIDPSLLIFDETRPFVLLSGGNPRPLTEATIEFSSQSYASEAELRGNQCDAGPWESSMAAVAGGAEAVTTVRVSFHNDIAPGGSMRFFLPMKALSNPPATVLPAYLVSNWDGRTNWATGTYVSADHSGYGGDRVNQASSLVRTSISSPGVSSAAPGAPVKFEVASTLTLSSQSPTVHDVQIVVNIPSCLEYLSGSAIAINGVDPVFVAADPGPDGVSCTADDANNVSTLTWVLGDWPVGDPLPVLTYEAQVPVNAPVPATLLSSAVISSPDDSSLESYRTSTSGIAVNGFSEFAVAKRAPAEIEVGDPVPYRLSWANRLAAPVGSAELVDILPNAADGRGTTFTGDFTYLETTGSLGVESLWFTNAPLADLQADPHSASIVWSATPLADATAIKVRTIPVVPGGFGYIDLNFDADNSLKGDLLKNSIASTKIEGLSLIIGEAGRTTTKVTASSIGNIVWNDANANGVHDSGEAGVPGITMELSGYSFGPDGVDDGGAGDDEAVSMTTTTDAQGAYSFDGLHSGSYSVTMTDDLAAMGWRLTADPAANPVPVQTFDLGLARSSDPVNVNFGVLEVLPVLTLVKSETAWADSNSNTLRDEGDVLTYGFTVTNTGNDTVTGLGITDVLPGVSAVTCAATTLAAGASTTCSATYTVTEADQLAETLTNEATASATDALGRPVDSNPAEVTVPLDAVRTISLVKTVESVDTDADQLVDEGSVIHYLFTVENTGNTRLLNVDLSDDLAGLSALTCDTATGDPSIAELLPGEGFECRATVDVTVDDVMNGSVDNTAEVTSVDPNDVVVADDDSVTVNTNLILGLDLKKEITGMSDEDGNGLNDAGDIITYQLTVQNTSNVELTDVEIVDSLKGLSALDCDVTDGVLAAGATMVCEATYTVTEQDVYAEEIVNDAYATGKNPSGDAVESLEDTVLQPLDARPSLELIKTIDEVTDADSDGYVDAGDTVTFGFDITNTGNLSMHDVIIDDGLEGLSAITCKDSLATIAPGDTVHCTATYVITEGDEQAREVINTAFATGHPVDAANPLVTSATSTVVQAVEKAPVEAIVPPQKPADEQSKPGGLVVTGTEFGWGALGGALLLILGAGMMIRRRKSVDLS